MKNLWVPVSAAIAQQNKVETIANNVANVNTPGFKKDALVFKEYLAALENGNEDVHLPSDVFKPKDFYHSEGSEHSFVRSDGSYTDFSQGVLSPSSNPTDAAIKGPGMFELESPNGVRYSRVGQFSINSEGYLVNDQGLKYLGNSGGNALNTLGTPDRGIKMQDLPFQINLQGEIFQNGNKVGQLSVVEFSSNALLRKEGSHLFLLDNPKPETSGPGSGSLRLAQNSTIYQGFVESSNVNPIIEMSELIKANRNFESIQRAIKTYDAMDAKAMSEISKF